MPRRDEPTDDLARTEAAKTITAIAETARRARREAPLLPHPFETDALLAAKLDEATVLATGDGRRNIDDTAGGRRAKLSRKLLEWAAPGQIEFNRQLIDVIHQLDHRDRQLREEVADLHQRLDAIEATRGRGAAMTTRRRIGVIKPDTGSIGGFERHVEGLMAALAGQEWDLELVSIPVERVDRIFGIALDEPIRDRHDEYFLWAALVEKVQRLDLSRFDAIITTQPPTYLAEHPRKLALFYHHARQFYDQSELFVDSGFVDPMIHAAAVAAVRSVEASVPHTVGHWLAGSREVADRLRHFWGVPDDAITVHAAPPTSIPERPPPFTADGPVLTVGRFEWPKRQELAIAAAWAAGGGWTLDLVGGGSRMGHARRIDAAIAADSTVLAELGDDELWRNTGSPCALRSRDERRDEHRGGASPIRPSPVRFLGMLDDEERDAAYASCSVVLTPTHREDYGLTVLEAMARARPVVVCDDGGGLTEFVRHGINGLVVEPNPQAIATAIEELLSDPARAERMGTAGLELVAEVSWDRAVSTVADGLRRVLDRPG